MLTESNPALPFSRLLVYAFDKLKETELGDVNGFEISADGKKMIVGAEGGYAIIEVPSAKIDLKDLLSLNGMRIQLDRHAEWNQMFNECWRQMRDFFFAPNMHGVDWIAMRTKYAVLLPYVNTRADLTYVIGEMIGELNIGHAYVGGGDIAKPERISLGLLGATLVRDGAPGFSKARIGTRRSVPPLQRLAWTPGRATTSLPWMASRRPQ
jgi:tricorn protease